MFTTYEALLVDGRGLAARLNAGLALGLGQAAPGAVEAFIDPSLRRQRVCGGDGADWVGQVHAIMQRWAETGEDAQDHARLDAIAAALAEAGGCFAALVADGRAQLPELADLRGRLTAMRGAMVAEARRSAEESASLHARVYDEQTRVAKASAAAAEMELQLHEARDWVFRLSAERAAAAREAQRLTRAAAASAREAAAASGAVRRLEAALAAEVAGRAESQKAAFEAGRAALAGELAQARGHLRDAEDAQRAQAAALAERFEEIAQITAMLQARDGEVARLSALVDTAQAASEAAQVACAALTAQLGDALASCAEADVTRQAAEAARARDEDERGQLAAQLATTQAALHEAQAQAQAQGAALAERFDEIAHLARLLGAREAEARLASARVQWLRGVAGDLLRALGLWRWLPGAGWFARRRLLAGLRARGEFDARFYLRTHSDVAGAGMDPLRHYILFGQDEGRAPCAEMGRDARATARGGVLAAALATTVAATSTEGGLV